MSQLDSRGRIIADGDERLVPEGAERYVRKEVLDSTPPAPENPPRRRPRLTFWRGVFLTGSIVGLRGAAPHAFNRPVKKAALRSYDNSCAGYGYAISATETGDTGGSGYGQYSVTCSNGGYPITMTVVR